ncbi:MAG: dihydrofolate reductase family protein [Candidatus Bathyarchaeia archaeon]
MGKLFTFMTISLDGFFEGRDHDISWHNVDDESNKFAIEMLRETDTILFGRRTYELFEDFWPKAADDPKISQGNLEIARLINNMNKVVFSRTLTKVEEKENWRNVKLIRDVNPEEIKRWKQESGKDLCIGGSNLAVSFAQLGLIDEIRIMLDPVVLGKGTRLFEGIKDKLNLSLLKTRTFKSGNVLLYYQPKYGKW